MNDEVQLGDTAPITEDVLASTASSAGASGAASAPAPGRTSTSEAEAIRVAIRIRPLSEKEKLVNPVATIDINSNTSITMKAPEVRVDDCAMLLTVAGPSSACVPLAMTDLTYSFVA